MSVGSGGSSFGPTDAIAESKEQRARAEALQRLNPVIGHAGDYTTAIPDVMSPRVITISAAHASVETVFSDNAAVLRVENRLLHVIIGALVDRVERLGGGNGDMDPEIAECLADVRGLARQAMAMEQRA